MPHVLGLVGETGSGKDTFCQYFKKKFKKVYCFRFSDPLTQALRIFFDEVKKEDQQWLAISLRKRFGSNILGEAIAKRIKTIKKGIIILDGLRVFEEYEMIKDLGGKIIYITATPKVRWQRIQDRREKKDDKVSFEKFLEIEKAKTENLIGKIGKKADFKIENNGTLGELYQKLDELLEKLGPVR